MASEMSLYDCWCFIQQLVKGRWFSLFASFWIMIGAGATYMFGTYSKEIKTEFNYSQTQLNILGFAKDFGSNLGVIAGLLAEVVPTSSLFIVGSILNFFSYFMIWLSVTHRIATPKFWQMCAYIALATNSQNFANTAVLVTCVRNFPDRRGVILGLLKGFVGLGGAVLTQLYLAIYGSKHPSNLILLLSWLPTAIALILSFPIRSIKCSRNPNELRVFYHFLHVSIILALVLLALNLTQKQTVFSHTAYIVGGIIIVILLCFPLLIAIREEYTLFKFNTQLPVSRFSTWSNNQEHHPTEIIIESKPPPSFMIDEISESDESSCFSNIFDKPERGEDFTILQALFSKDMAIIFMATLCGTGSTIAAIDNLGQIGESLHYPTKAISIFISLFSVMNFFGRVFSGFISETLMVKYKLPRPLMFAFFLLLSCIGQLFIVFPSHGSVYIASLIIGLAFGGQVPILFAIISELFGLKHYAVLFNFGQLAIPIGSWILNVEIIGNLYDLEATRKGFAKEGKGLTCMGANCFSTSFTILACVTFFGAIVSLFLAFRTRQFYRGDIYKQFREDLWLPQQEIEFYQFNDKKNTNSKTKPFRPRY